MTAHLLALSVGPVQEFIAAARRTRDLWFGSFLLSELSKAAARAISQKGGRQSLIFPAPQRAEDLEPESPLSVANVLLAEVPAGYEPSIIAALMPSGSGEVFSEPRFCQTKNMTK